MPHHTIPAASLSPSPPQPTDLVKVRMQSEGRLLPGQKPRYSGVMNAYSTIVRTEGVLGLWTGLGPAILRNSVINATELASYETAKEALVYNFGMKDGLPAHIAAGAAAGLMATIIGNPVDVIKTRVMAARKAAELAGGAAAATAAAGGSGAAAAGAGGAAGAASAPVVYRGAIDCVVQTLRHEGPMAFYQGVVPQFYRLTGWSIVMFVSFEKLKAVAAESLAARGA
jgi:solute carrier family 25 uncoupling protein 8/9